MSRRVETLIAACFYYSGLVKLARWWTQRSRQRLVILNYHCAAGGDFYRATEADLRSHLLYLRRHYRILHLETALEELYKPYKNELQKRDQRTSLVLTFDDGYHDNYTHAFTLACELQVPITIFLVPGYIESGNCFWWFEGAHLVAHALTSEVMIEGDTYHLNKLDERKALVQAIDTRVRYAVSVIVREEFLGAVRKLLKVPPSVTTEEKGSLPLTWVEVQAMEKSEWVSFGAHTMHHPILAYLTDPTEVQYEVSECRAVLERQLRYPVRTFAYPVGELEHIGENGIPAVQQAEYKWAVTAIYGFNTAQTDPYFLHRIVMDVGQHWLLVAAKASGVWNFFTRLYRMPMTLIRKRLKSNQQR